MKAFLTRTACELLMLGGLFALVYGLWLAWHPLGFILGGLLLASGAFFVHYSLNSSMGRNHVDRVLNDVRKRVA